MPCSELRCDLVPFRFGLTNSHVGVLFQWPPFGPILGACQQPRLGLLPQGFLYSIVSLADPELVVLYLQ